MNKLLKIIAVCVCVVFVSTTVNYAGWFGFGSSKTDNTYDKNLEKFLTFYDAELKSNKDELQYRNLFVNAYDILIDNYVYELSDKQLKSMLDNAQEAITLKEKELKIAKKPISSEVLTDTALRAMYNSLDPHTEWLNKEETSALKNSIDGEYKGVGIVLGVEKKAKYVKAISVIEGGPAYKAGVKDGDLIYKINGKLFTAKQLSIVASLLKGKDNSTVTIVVKRGKEEKTFVIKRGTVNLKTVYSEMLNDKYAYIRISTFNYNTTAELRSELRKLKINKDQGIILDLRSNPGGLLYSSLIIANMFIDKGTLLSVKGRDKNFDMTYYAAKKKEVNGNIPIVILVNNMTASAAEILSAALSQTGRAIVMGQNSFGKGSVQTVYDLKDGSSAKVTIQLFYTPNGEALQGIGVVPDIYLNPVHKNDFYDIRETNYKNSLIAQHDKKDYKKSSKTIDAATCKVASKSKDNEIGCALDYLIKQNAK
ncbi:S41 family peptidase [Rickettsiales bacterium LUAb2]